jgi:RNA polymerase sigma-70 factor (ECF subfamily)
LLTERKAPVAPADTRLRRVADEKLLAWLRAGDERGVEELVTRHGGVVYRLARRLLNDPRDAEEVTQDVLLTVVEKIHTFRGEAAFSSWIYRIATNAAYERLRSRRSRPEVSLESFFPVFDAEGRHAQPMLDWSDRLNDPGVIAETRGAIEQAINHLPPEYQTAVLLRDVEGLTNEEVAATLGLTVAAVKSRVHRARLVLRGQLARYFAGWKESW